METFDWPWQYSFPPFFTVQPHSETKSKQITAWRHLVLDYHKANKKTTLDVRESTPLFNNSTINRKLPVDGILLVLEDLYKTGNAEPIDKTKNRWHIYWHSLDEWADLIYTWAQSNAFINTVCTLYEITEGDNSTDEEFHGLDTTILIKALKRLETSEKAELIQFDDNQGVKFF